MRLLFVCLGNICRSPIAEAVMADLVRLRRDSARWTLDSAAIGPWHVGSAPDPRALATLARHGLRTAHRGRQVAAADFSRFDQIFAMDRANLDALNRQAPPGALARIGLLGAHDPEGRDEVPDPYHGGDDDFEFVQAQVRRCCAAFLARVPDQG